MMAVQWCLLGALACARVASAQSGSACLSYINSFRNQQGVPALSYMDAQTGCVDSQAQQDQSGGFHSSFGKCGENGQCECWRQPNDVKGCIQAYIDEGPGGGHYEILRDSKYTHVSCGYYLGSNNMAFYTQSFYSGGSSGSAPQAQQQQQQEQPAPQAAQQAQGATKQPDQTSGGGGDGGQAQPQQQQQQQQQQEQTQPVDTQGAPETPIQGGVWGSMMDKWLHKQDGSKAQDTNVAADPTDCADGDGDGGAQAGGQQDAGGGTRPQTVKLNWNGQMIDVALPQDVIDQIQQAMGGR